MANEFLWLAAAAAGYFVAMSCSPLRAFFADGFNLMRERGRVRLWLPVALLSLLPASFGWFSGEPPGADVRASKRQFAATSSAAADGAGLFTSVVNFRPADACRELPVRTRAGLTIGAMSWAALAVSCQFFVMVAFYLGIVLPSREPGVVGLIDFSWRRMVRFWPGVVAVGLFSVLPLWIDPDAALAAVLWPMAACLAIVFAFVQASLLSGERHLKAAVANNFNCWIKLPHFALWYLALAALHLFVLYSVDTAAATALVGRPFWSVLWVLLFSLIRAGVLVWLLATWVVLFCSKTKNPTRRRIQP